MPFLPLPSDHTRAPSSDAQTRAPLPAGWYAARIDNALRSESRSGTPLVKIVFAVEAGPHTGRLVFADYYLTEAARERSMRDIRNLVEDVGFEYDGSDEALCDEIAAIVGNPVDIKVAVEQARDGFPAHNRVRDTAKCGARVPHTPTPAGASASAPASASRSPALPTPPPPPEVDMSGAASADDMPF